MRRVRHNVSFHYYRSGKNLADGYRSTFYKRIKTEDNAYAYYAIKLTDLDTTRFFYADAALEGYMKNLLEAQGEDGETYKDVIEFSVLVSRCLCDIMYQYLRTKPAQ